ncbi:LamG domain-containing protein [Kineococcus sp. NUM-3379]
MSCSPGPGSLAGAPRRLPGLGRTGALLAVLVALGMLAPPLAWAAFSASVASSSPLTVAASFPNHPAAVNAASPSFYHRLEDASGSPTAADSSANASPGVHAGASAVQPVWMASFDEGAGGVVNDVSGDTTRQNGAFYPAAGWVTPGRTGSGGAAAAFDGARDMYTSGGAVVNTSQSFTVSAWVNLSSAATGYRTAVSQDGEFLSGFYLQYDAFLNQWCLSLRPVDTATNPPLAEQACAPGTAARDTWVHLVGNYDSAAATMSLYVNGIWAATTARTAAGWNAPNSLVVGGAKFPTGGANTRVDQWLGAIDDVRVYQRTLSAAQVRELYAGVTANPSTAWDFSEAAGTTATGDSSGAGNTGALGSGASLAASGATGHGNAVTLNKTANGHVRGGVPAVDTTRSFTVAARVRITDTAATYTAVSQSSPRISGFFLQYWTGTGKWCLTMPDGDTASATPVGAWACAALGTGDANGTTWVHLVGVYDAEQKKISFYRNGVHAETVDRPATPWRADGPLTVGQGIFAGAQADFFSGGVDQVRTWQRVLTAGEVTALAGSTTGSTGATTHAGTTYRVTGALQGAQKGLQAHTGTTHSAVTGGYNATRRPTGPTTFSVACWFRATGGNGGTLVSFGSEPDGFSATVSRRLHLSGTGALVFGTDSGTANTVSHTRSGTGGWADGAWHHVVVTVNPTAGQATSGVRLYVDGVLRATGTHTAVPTGSGVWRWGGDVAGTTWPAPGYLTGSLDEVAVWNTTALSAQQVSWQYHANH